MNVWNGIKKRQNGGPKKKRSSSEGDSDSSDDDHPVIRVQKYGKVIPAEQLGGEDLDVNDVHLLEGLGDHFDI
jgi:hypothetical protein